MSGFPTVFSDAAGPGPRPYARGPREVGGVRIAPDASLPKTYDANETCSELLTEGDALEGQGGAPEVVITSRSRNDRRGGSDRDRHAVLLCLTGNHATARPRVRAVGGVEDCGAD